MEELQEKQKKKDNAVREFKVKLTPEESEILERKSSEVGMTKIGYIKKLLSQDMNVLYVQDTDFREYAAEIEEVNKTLRGILNFMKRSDEAVIYKQDIERITEIMQEIKNVCNEQLQLSYSNRNQIRKILRTLVRYSYRHEDGSSEKDMKNLVNKIVSIWTTGKWR